MVRRSEHHSSYLHPSEIGPSISSPPARRETSIFDLEALFAPDEDGDLGSAIEALRWSWPSAVAEHGSRLRAILDGLDPKRWEDDPWLVTAYAASYRSIGSPSRSAALPYFSAAGSAMTNATPAGIRIAWMLHYSASLRGLGRLAEALSTADEARSLLEADSTLPLSFRIALGTKVGLQRGLALHHLGDYDGAAAELGLVSGLVDCHLHPSEKLEFFGGMAMEQYFSGNFGRALEFVGLARSVGEKSPLTLGQFGAGALTAELLICVEQGRLGEADALAPLVDRAGTNSEWEPLSLYSRAAISIIRKKYVEGLELLRRCRQSYSTWSPPGSIIVISEGLRATILLRLGEADSARDILGSLEPTQHHSHCPGRFLAQLSFRDGDIRGALATLQDCEALGDAHSSRTLVDVMLIKAAATHQLSSFAISDFSFDRAMMLAAGNHLSAPFRLVPNSVMKAMIERAFRRPQSREMSGFLKKVHDSGPIVGGMDSALLSAREREIVRAMTRNLAVPEIAKSLFISVNTVKTHVKSIYRKLGVHSRADAIKRAKSLGLQ